MDVARYGDYANLAYTNAKVQENYRRRFRITFPNEELPAARPLLTTPIHDRLTAANAVWGATFGLEHALWFQEAGLEPVEEVTFHRSNAWECVAEEVAAVRERVGMTEISNYAKYRVTGPGAEAWLSSLLTARMPAAGPDHADGDAQRRGRIVGEFTVARADRRRGVLPVRLAARRRSTTRAGSGTTCRRTGRSGSRCWAWGSTGCPSTGPRSRDVLAAVAPDLDLSTEAFPFMTFRQRGPRDDAGPPRPDQLRRRARLRAVGRAGVPARRCSTGSWPPGEPHGLRLFGMRALMSLRLEKSYGTWFREYRPIYTPAEGGITRYLRLDHDFIGRAAHEAEVAAGGPKRRLVAMVVEPDPDEPADVIGDEPIWHDGEVVGWVTSGGYGHHVRAVDRPGLRSGRARDTRRSGRQWLRDRDHRPAPAGPPPARAAVRPAGPPDAPVTASPIRCGRSAAMCDDRSRSGSRSGPARRRRWCGSQAAAVRGDGIPDGATIVDLSELTVLPGLIDVHTHLVGDVQTAGVPSTTTSAAEEVLIGVRHARETIEGRLHDRPRRRLVPGVHRLRPARRHRPRRRRRAADAVRRRVHHRAVGRWRRRRPGPRHRPARGPPLRRRADRSTKSASACAGCSSAAPSLIKCIGTGAVLTRGGVPGAPGAERGGAPRGGRGGRLVRRLRRGPRPRRRGGEAGDPGRRAVDRARLVPGRRGDRDARRHGHVLQRRPVRRRVGARARRVGGLAGRDDAQARRVARMRREAGVCGRRSSAASGSPSAPTAASIRTASTPGSSRRTSELGMSPLAAIRTATTVAAECMGWSDRVGSLAVGRFADLVAVAGDPLEDVTELERPVVTCQGRSGSSSIDGANAAAWRRVRRRRAADGVRGRRFGRRRHRPFGRAGRRRRHALPGRRLRQLPREVDGVAYVRTCQVAARPGSTSAPPRRWQADPADGNLRETDVAVQSTTGRRGRRRRRLSGSRRRPNGRGRLVLDARSMGGEVVGIYPGPAVVARTPDGMLHVAGDEVVVATGTAEIQPVCPGSDLAGILTARAAERSSPPASTSGGVADVGPRARPVRRRRPGRVRAVVTRDVRRRRDDDRLRHRRRRPRPGAARRPRPDGAGRPIDVSAPSAMTTRCRHRRRPGVVCRCMGTTVDDLDVGLGRRLHRLELLKRASWAGLGPCQGGACLPHLRAFIAARTGDRARAVHRPPRRPPDHARRGRRRRRRSTPSGGRRSTTSTSRSAPGWTASAAGGGRGTTATPSREYWAVREGVSIGDVVDARQAGRLAGRTSSRRSSGSIRATSRTSSPADRGTRCSSTSAAT